MAGIALFILLPAMRVTLMLIVFCTRTRLAIHRDHGDSA
jgi:hypothetical protein